MQSNADGPATSGGHRFASDAWKSGVPKDWALGLASPAVRERRRLDAEEDVAAKKAEANAMAELKLVWAKYPAMRGGIALLLQKGVRASRIVSHDQFRVLVREQERRREVYLREIKTT